MHIKSKATVVSKTPHVDNTLGKSINLLKCVCHASLSFIDPFNNPIIKLMCCVLNRVPTSSGNHGKPGKSQIKIPCMEKSWNLIKAEKSWKNHGIL